MGVMEQFWSASLEEAKQGYVERPHTYMCLLCGAEVEKGIVYPVDGVLFEASRYMRYHIEQEHESVFAYLSGLDKRLTGLSDHQASLLRLFFAGKTDAEVQAELGIGSASTIRNHRFALKEKERQAKVFLTLMELLREADKNSSSASADKARPRKPEAAEVEAGSAEYEAILQKYFPQGPSDALVRIPRKHKHRLVICREVAKRFAPDKMYTEREVNDMLEAVCTDYVTLRRYLIDYGFLDREADGSAYWRTGKDNNEEEQEERSVNRKQELKQMYKEVKSEAGVYQIRNKVNGKVLVASSLNLKTINGKKFMLQHGSHPNRELQKEWNELGADAFAFEVLEVLKPKDDPYFDAKDALEKLEEKWIEKLAPYNERGYHQEKRM
ncbi:DUF2087 domain-containing protein [Brevibacillus sp. SAFN-007a]|uniref:DUF2087 domain-containing protein n=1 Tax=Brevibacillus sp. SAFN-007a TaxID=3436862 RepID=UPI003F821DF3